MVHEVRSVKNFTFDHWACGLPAELYDEAYERRGEFTVKRRKYCADCHKGLKITKQCCRCGTDFHPGCKIGFFCRSCWIFVKYQEQSGLAEEHNQPKRKEGSYDS